MKKTAIILSLSIVFFELHDWGSQAWSEHKGNIIEIASDRRYSGLIINLLIAWFAVALGKFKGSLVLDFFWLLFLPNTLYMVTDLKYFGAGPEPDYVYDFLFFAMYAIVGLQTYILAILPRWEQQHYDKKWFWIVLALSIVGVIVGRITRWNSWDLFLNPQKLLNYF